VPFEFFVILVALFVLVYALSTLLRSRGMTDGSPAKGGYKNLAPVLKLLGPFIGLMAFLLLLLLVVRSA
jgi:hypothetical protein